MKPLFVSGCARSGTTALAKFLGAQPDVLLGVERYGKLFQPGMALQREHLTLARFRELRAGDCAYTDFEGRYRWDPLFEKKLSGEHPVRYIGDKKPGIYRHYNALNAEFPEASYVFIYRDPLAVALSWKNRAARGNAGWRRDRGAKQAIKEWNHAIACTREAAAKYLDVIVVNYDQLFFDLDYSGLLEKLQLPDGDGPRAWLSQLHKRHINTGKGARQKTFDSLTEEETQLVLTATDVDALTWADSAAAH